MVPSYTKYDKQIRWYSVWTMPKDAHNQQSEQFNPHMYNIALNISKCGSEEMQQTILHTLVK